jgi:hypothetical protein
MLRAVKEGYWVSEPLVAMAECFSSEAAQISMPPGYLSWDCRGRVGAYLIFSVSFQSARRRGGFGQLTGSLTGR